MNDIEKVRKVFEQLIREGYADNEADARLLAIRLIVLADRVCGRRPSNDDDG
ncbi:MAG TPA: hypothetical protein VGH69_07395 [Mycobacterium sp.]|jgi:hypothetical protein